MRPSRDTPHGKRLLRFLHEVELGTEEAIEVKIRELASLSAHCAIVRDQIGALRQDHENLLQRGYEASLFADGKVWYSREDDSEEEMILTHIDESLLKSPIPGGTWGMMPQEGPGLESSGSRSQLMELLNQDDLGEVTPSDIPASYFVRPSKYLKRKK
jgi:hypothetical protein